MFLVEKSPKRVKNGLDNFSSGNDALAAQLQQEIEDLEDRMKTQVWLKA